MARLIITTGGQPEQTVELGGEIVTVGREAGNTVVLSGESKASRKHCQIVPVSGGGFEVVDLQSTNGTRMNGQAVTRLRLKPGDVIEVGLSKMRFEDPVAAAKAAENSSVCYLEYIAGDRRGERVVLTGPRTTFGRRETNTVVLNDKMASGHHAEITKDLNGYTVRDLGSTNGTLVNGDLVTETLLTHGSRLRVGNAKFVFKDPSMKDVEIELAGLEEDDAGWGMMAELDLAKSGGGMGSLLAAVGLLAAMVAGAVYVAGLKPPVESEERETGNRIQDGRFESQDVVWWTVPEGSPATAERVAQAKTGGGELVVKHDGHGTGVGIVRYAEDLQMTQSGAYKASARMKKDGPGRAQLAMQWIRLGNAKSGATAVTQTVALGTASGAWADISATVRRPAWAEAGRLVVLVAPETTARLDDVRFEPSSSDAEARGGKIAVAGDAEATIEAGGALDLSRSATVLAVGATPWAKMPDGRVLGGPDAFEVATSSVSATEADIAGSILDDKGQKVPVKIHWATGSEGLSAAITVDGASEVGLSADFPLAHLADKIEIYGSLTKTISPQPGPPLDGARKVQLGDPQPQAEVKRPATLVALGAPGSPEGMRLETKAAEDAGLARVLVWVKGSSGEVRIVTSFEAERKKAQEDLTKAKALLEEDTGAGIDRLREIAQEYAFQDNVRREALEKANAAADSAAAAAKDLAEAISKFAVYGSEDSLAEAERLASELAKRFPAGGAGKGALEQQVRSLALDVRERRWKFDVERATPEVKRLSRLAALLEGEQGFEAVAAQYYDDIVWRFEALAAAGSPTAYVAKQVEEARQHLDALLKIAAVQAAFAPVPREKFTK